MNTSTQPKKIIISDPTILEQKKLIFQKAPVSMTHASMKVPLRLSKNSRITAGLFRMRRSSTTSMRKP